MTSGILSAVRAHAMATPTAPALTGDTLQLDYATLVTCVDALADWLGARGIRRAALCGDNSPLWLIADLAAWQAGVVLVPVPPFFSASQRAHVLGAAGIGNVLDCGEGDIGAETAEPTPVDGIRLRRIASADAPVDMPAGTCKITFTSGTTGTPKGVCLDTPMLDAVSMALADRIHRAPGLSHAVQRHFTLLPLATLLENVAGAYVPLLLGRCVLVRGSGHTGLEGSSRLDLHRLLQSLHQDRPHSLIVLPQILHGLVEAAGRGAAPPDSLRFIAVGGAATPPALIHRARALGLPVYEGYGLSECASVLALNAPGADRVGSVGRVLPHVRVRIEQGAIHVAGNVFPGYLGQTAGMPRDGWFDTGDLGHLDDDGFLHVTGRRKHLLITGYGRNVSPEWIEAELVLGKGIAQAMVVGEAQAFLAAIVVATPGTEPAAVAREIALANMRLPDYAQVRRFLLAPEPFTTANGLLTDNGRLRRDAIAQRHTAALTALFDSAPSLPAMEPAHDVL